VSPQPTTAEVLARLEVLYHTLEADGFYVQANTVWLAMELIKTLTPKTEA
jgi:hypothetical protein